jgi:hypothetical protein
MALAALQFLDLPAPVKSRVIRKAAQPLSPS